MELRGLGLMGHCSCQDTVVYSKIAEDRGYDSVWVSEDLGFRDAVTQLASVAASTHRIKLATGILPIYYRTPALAAMTIAALDELSHGRAILGIGTGASYLQKQGIESESPLRAMEEFIFVVRRLLSGRSLTYQGHIYRLTDVELSFRPLNPQIPIYVAARGPRMLTLAGKLADGVLANDGFCAEKYIRWALDNVKVGAENAGRKARDITFASLVWVSVSEDRDEAKEYVKPWLLNLLVNDVFNPHLEKLDISIDEVASVKKAWEKGNKEEAYRKTTDAMINATSIHGTSDECAEKMRRFRSAGVTLPIIVPVGPDIRGIIELSKNW